LLVFNWGGGSTAYAVPMVSDAIGNFARTLSLFILMGALGRRLITAVLTYGLAWRNNDDKVIRS
jgi:hypothetical protein